MKIDKKEVINKLSEKFRALDIKMVDAKNRINLGEKIFKAMSDVKAEAYKVFVGEDGDILLRPVVTIPSKEAWIYRNPKVLAQIRQGLRESKQGKTERVEDVEQFLEDL